MQGTTSAEGDEARYGRKNFEPVKRQNQFPNKYVGIIF
jgi:hypothetical protein